MAIQQHNPPHVGGMIFRTYIEPFDGVSANKIADALGVARSTFNRLLNEKSDLSTRNGVRYQSYWVALLKAGYVYKKTTTYGKQE